LRSIYRMLEIESLDNQPIGDAHVDLTANGFRNENVGSPWFSALDQIVDLLRIYNRHLIGSTITNFKRYNPKDPTWLYDCRLLYDYIKEYAQEERHGITLITSPESFAKWENTPSTIGVLPFFEGIYDDLFTSKEMFDWQKEGVVGGSLTWIHSNNLAASQLDQKHGLTERGKTFIKGLCHSPRPIMVDISHASQLSAQEMMEIAKLDKDSSLVFVATHANVGDLYPKDNCDCSGQQNIKKRTVEMLVERDGYVGLLPWKGALGPESKWPELTFDDWVQHLEKLVEYGIPIDHIFIGTDPPRDTRPVNYLLDEANIHPLGIAIEFGKYLLKSGYSYQQVRGILYDNYLNFARKLFKQ
jgi:microsomal dipeptidase-like Zn-dependent dipeptidase